MFKDCSGRLPFNWYSSLHKYKRLQLSQLMQLSQLLNFQWLHRKATPQLLKQLTQICSCSCHSLCSSYNLFSRQLLKFFIFLQCSYCSSSLYKYASAAVTTPLILKDCSRRQPLNCYNSCSCHTSFYFHRFLKKATPPTALTADTNTNVWSCHSLYSCHSICSYHSFCSCHNVCSCLLSQLF